MKNLTIKTKLILLFVGTFFIFATLSWWVLSKELKKKEFNDAKEALHALNTTKVSEIKRTLANIKSLILVKGKNLQTMQAFESFNDSFYKIDKELHLNVATVRQKLANDFNANYLPLVNYTIKDVPPRRPTVSYIPKNPNAVVAQYMLIAKNPAPVGKKDTLAYNPDFHCDYMQIHKRYHPQFRAFLQTFGLYDLFLVNLKGDVIYTVFKEKDFSTNLFHGPYAKTGLAQVYKKSLHLKKGQIAFSDFAPYEASYNELASFIATPIFKGKKRVGSLIFQMPLSVISTISSFKGEYKDVGLGATGDSFLINKVYRVFTEPRLFKNKKFKNSLTEDAFLKNFHGGAFFIKEQNVKYLVALHKIDVFKQSSWLFVTQMQVKEILQPIQKLQINLLLLIVFLLSLFIFIYIFTLKKMIINPIDAFAKGMESFFNFINGKSKELHPITISTQDEIGKIAHSVNENIETLTKTFQEKEEHQWIQNGLQNLDNKLLTHTQKEKMFEFCTTFVTQYVDGSIAVFYLYDEEKEYLEFVTGYAIDDEHIQKQYKLKEGIIGEVAFSKKNILTKIDKEFIVETALTQTYPTQSYVFALVFQNKLVGVIEVAKLQNFEKKHIDFLRKASNSIAAAITTIVKNSYIESLLEHSKEINESLQEQKEELQEQTEELRVQSEELHVSNAHMQEQQKALQEAKDKIEQSLKYKSEFLANMSHELRTPLNSIILLSKLLAQNSTLAEDERQKSSVINQAGQSLLELINDILDLSKMEANQLQLSFTETTTKEIATQMHDLFLPITQEKGIELIVSDEANITFKTDKMKLLQVVKNLLSNAIKFTSQGSVVFSIKKENTMLILSVKDSGIGIAKEKQDTIFEAFVQADGSTSRVFGGTGLGLSISKKIVTALGGKIAIESSLGDGATFSVTIPLKNATNIEKPTTTKEEQKEEEISQEERPTQIPLVEISQTKEPIEKILLHKNILIVDDDSRNIFTLTATLEEMGAEVFSAFNGEEAIQTLQETQESMSLILMDIMMPVMDGLEAIKTIKSMQEYKNIPIIVISAKNMQEDIDTFFEAGADEYLPKPLNLESLAKVLQAWT